VNKGKMKGRGCYGSGPRSRYVALNFRRGDGGLVS